MNQAVTVTDARTNRRITFDGATFDGDRVSLRELDRLIDSRAMIALPDSHAMRVRASITGSDEVLLATLHHAVAPATPYASFVESNVGAEDEKAPQPGTPKGVNSTPMGRTVGKKQTSVSLLQQRVPLTPEVVEFKIGLLNSGSRSTQGLETIASTAIPGDMSEWRSPVRSRLYAAITPGGGRDRRRNRIGGFARRRCPTGFEFGGRFASANFGNCGRRLFAAVGDVAGGATGVRRGVDLNPFDRVGLLEGSATPIGAGPYRGRAVQIARNAQIAAVGPYNRRSQTSAILRAANIFDNGASDQIRLIRRDGVELVPTVPIITLATAGARSPDMDGAVFVSVRKDPLKIGDVEIPVMLRSNMRGATFAVPGGGSISIEKKRPLSSAEKRRLNRVWATSQTVDNYDFAAPMRRLVDQSDGALTYTEKFPYKNHDDLIGVTNGKRSTSVRRWVFNAYLADKAPGSIGEPWRETRTAITDNSLDSPIGSVTEAIAFLNGGGDPRKVPALYLSAALKASRSFKRTQVGDGVALYTRGRTSFYELASKTDYEHLAHRVSADLHEVLGMESPDVRLMGAPGKRRSSLIEFPTGRLTEATGYRQGDPADLLRLAIADFLLDQRDRDPLTLATVRRGGKTRLIASENGGSLLSGLSGARKTQRQKLKLDDFYNEQRRKDLLDRFSNLTDTQKKLLLGTYDDALKRAVEWNVDDYVEKLTIDGVLSSAERLHLDAMKTLYGDRLSSLRNNKKTFLTMMGIDR